MNIKWTEIRKFEYKEIQCVLLNVRWMSDIYISLQLLHFVHICLLQLVVMLSAWPHTHVSFCSKAFYGRCTILSVLIV